MRNAPTALAGAAVLLLQGCGAMTVQDYWLPDATHAALRPFHIEVTDEQLSRACGDAPALKYYGCALRIPAERMCVIYTTPEPAAWVMDHERRHCAGWDHT